MERLTRWIDDTKDIAIENKEATKDECLKRLAEYEDAEENQSLIKFPVGFEQKIYFLLPSEGVVDAFVRKLKITDFGYVEFQVDYFSGNHLYSMCFTKDDIGKDVFLTREDAEERLKELEG